MSLLPICAYPDRPCGEGPNEALPSNAVLRCKVRRRTHAPRLLLRSSNRDTIFGGPPLQYSRCSGMDRIYTPNRLSVDRGRQCSLMLAGHGWMIEFRPAPRNVFPTIPTCPKVELKPCTAVRCDPSFSVDDGTIVLRLEMVATLRHCEPSKSTAAFVLCTSGGSSVCLCLIFVLET